MGSFFETPFGRQSGAHRVPRRAPFRRFSHLFGVPFGGLRFGSDFECFLRASRLRKSCIFIGGVIKNRCRALSEQTPKKLPKSDHFGYLFGTLLEAFRVSGNMLKKVLPKWSKWCQNGAPKGLHFEFKIDQQRTIKETPLKVNIRRPLGAHFGTILVPFWGRFGSCFRLVLNVVFGY